MIAVKNTDSEPGEPEFWRDCYRALWASILELDLADVPRFRGETPQQYAQAVRDWLAGFNVVPVRFSSALGLRELLHYLRDTNPKAAFILTGLTQDGDLHAVIIRDGLIVHDPAPSEPAIVRPFTDGLYWVVIIGSTRSIAHDAKQDMQALGSATERYRCSRVCDGSLST